MNQKFFKLFGDATRLFGTHKKKKWIDREVKQNIISNNNKNEEKKKWRKKKIKISTR